MNRKSQTLTPENFDGLYAADSDPWKFASSPYELEKYQITLDALPAAGCRRALKIGCSIGVLTLNLAARCAHLLAVYASTLALEGARRRRAQKKNVEFAQMFVPRD